MNSQLINYLTIINSINLVNHNTNLIMILKEKILSKEKINVFYKIKIQTTSKEIKMMMRVRIKMRTLFKI